MSQEGRKQAEYAMELKLAAVRRVRAGESVRAVAVGRGGSPPRQQATEHSHWDWYNKRGHFKSTKQGNPRIARQMEAAHRTSLAKGEVGIREEKPVPTLEAFKDTFVEWVRSTKDNERTQAFYRTCYEKLLDFKPLAHANLDKIDEPLIEQFKRDSLKVSRTTCNRYLSTLRKALRQRRLKLLDKLPVIELYGKEEGAERECEFVFTTEQYHAWLNAAREPMRFASLLAHDGGICRGELLSLKRDCINMIFA
jgi:hypothetical protein